jgi:hypothetical protein
MKQTDNVSSADNQQERSQEWLDKVPNDLGYYLTGFVNGEGSFVVSLHKRNDYSLIWKVLTTFSVSQKSKSPLEDLQSVLGCGTLIYEKDAVYRFSVIKIPDLVYKVIPFFERFPFRYDKYINNFKLFSTIVYMLHENEHKTVKGLLKIVSIREKLNEGKGRKRKYTEEDVLKSFLEKSSETIRRDLL